MQSEQIDSSHYHDEGAATTAPKKSQLLPTLFIAAVVLFVFCAMIAVLLLNRFGRNWISSGEEDDDAEMKFLIVGDYGRQGQFNQKEVAHEMGEWCKDNGKCDFIIGTGDNFYPDGTRTENDPQFAESFENIYTHEGIKDVRFYQVFGNHDYHQYPQSQLIYSKTKKTNFYIPNFYYSEVKQVGSLRVQFVFIDTNGFVESYKNFSRPTSRNATAIREAIGRADAQIQFIKSELGRYPIRQGKAGDEYVDFKVVVGHHPTYTPEAFHSDLPELISLLNPILYQHGALFYIAGHSHVLSHMVNNDEIGHELLPSGVRYNIHHIISGAGSSTRPLRENVPNLLRSQTDSGFIAAIAKKNKITMKFINYKGEETSEFDAHNPFFIEKDD